MTLICCPLNIDFNQKLTPQLANYQNEEYDILEIRIDYFNKYDFNYLLNTINTIKAYLKKPVIITLRTTKEGGKYDGQEYSKIVEFLIDNKLGDYLDLEYQQLNQELPNLISKIKNNNIKIILSYHQFNEHYSQDTLLSIYQEMILLPCDIIKIAVLAENNNNVVSFIKFSEKVKNDYHHKCLILMGELGCFSRFDLSYTNNNLLYASLEKNNAPGQLNLAQLKQILKK